MNNEKLRELAHKGIDRHCAGLRPDPDRVQRVLHMAEGKGEKKLKKKQHK